MKKGEWKLNHWIRRSWRAWGEGRNMISFSVWSPTPVLPTISPQSSGIGVWHLCWGSMYCTVMNLAHCPSEKQLYLHPQHTPPQLWTTQWPALCSTKQEVRVLFSWGDWTGKPWLMGARHTEGWRFKWEHRFIKSESASDCLKLQYQQGISMLLREADSPRTVFWCVVMIANGILSHKGNFKIMKAI